MSPVLETLKSYGYPLLFATVLVEQLGLPLPSTPVLLAAGALVGLGYLNWIPALLTVVVAAVLADLVWYSLGSYRGIGVLRLLCRMSIEPDHCVHSTEATFERWGPSILLVAKFIPGSPHWPRRWPVSRGSEWPDSCSWILWEALFGRACSADLAGCYATNWRN